MKTINFHFIVVLLSLLLVTSCATFRSDIQGRSGLAPKKTIGAEPVDVLFVARHLKQTRGRDAMPKLQGR